MPQVEFGPNARLARTVLRVSLCPYKVYSTFRFQTASMKRTIMTGSRAGGARRRETMKAIQNLKISISGVRGVVGETLTPTLLCQFAQSFGTYLRGGPVVVGSDTRTSREMAKHAVLAGLAATGCPVIDVGICPVPSVQLAVVRHRAAGGIAVTASHNPAQWNALKFLRADGIFLSPAHAEELLDIYHQGQYRRVGVEGLKRVRLSSTAIAEHVAAVLAHIDPEPIRRRRFKVVADCCNGAGALATPALLDALGCEAVLINERPDGWFAHNPEPVPENLGQLCRAVAQHGADLGFVQDADADRLAVVDERGHAIGEELSVTLATESVLRHTPGPVVVNLSTTNRVEAVAARYGMPVFRTPVGEVNVADEIVARGAVVGGEGSGGVIWPAVHAGRDSLCGMALILRLLAETDADPPLSMSALAASLPPSVMLKGKETCASDRARRLLAAFRERYAGVPVDTRDGVKLTLGDAWLHVRASRTEPVVRVAVEAPTHAEAQRLLDETLSFVRDF